MKKIILIALLLSSYLIKADCGVKRPHTKRLAAGPRTALFADPADVLFPRMSLFEPRYAGDEYYQV